MREYQYSVQQRHNDVQYQQPSGKLKEGKNGFAIITLNRYQMRAPQQHSFIIINARTPLTLQPNPPVIQFPACCGHIPPLFQKRMFF
mmetsp:Transcript_1058/g.1575  ORF Transcript_1058/g.1575 Transcript_1058/m.1575 type:complete len:87 (+) Transcript_1058:645-905(+)